MADEEKKKQRRIKGDAFWKLTRYRKKMEKAQEELAKWQQEKAEEAGVYADLINWNTGGIFSDATEIVNGVVRNGNIVGRLQKEVITEHRAKIEERMKLNEEIDAYRNKLAKVLHVWPDQIDWKTGKIDPEEFVGEELSAEPEEEEETEADAVKE